MSMVLLIAACALMGAAAVDYSSRPTGACWPELIGAAYAAALPRGGCVTHLAAFLAGLALGAIIWRRPVRTTRLPHTKE